MLLLGLDISIAPPLKIFLSTPLRLSLVAVYLDNKWSKYEVIIFERIRFVNSLLVHCVIL